MRDEITILGNLVKALDEARLFCVDAGVHMARPWLKRVLDQLAQTHQMIADDLCAHITTAGGGIRRDDRRRTWRASWLGWVARNHVDSDLAYIQQAKKHEDRLTRQFARAVRRTSDCGTHWRLERYLYEIDHARTKITRVVSLAQEGIEARRHEGHADTRAPAAVASPRSAAQERRHFEARGGGIT